MRIMCLVLAGLFFSSPLLVADNADDDAILAVVRTANEQHLADCRSGQMRVKMYKGAVDGADEFHLEGEYEWDEGYQYFEGEYRQIFRRPEDRKVLSDATAESVKYLKSGDRIASWTQTRSHSSPDFLGHSVWLFPESQMRQTPYAEGHLLPLPQTVLIARSVSQGPETSLTLVGVSPVANGVQFERKVRVDGSRVIVEGYFRPGVRHVATYDLDQGGLCVETSDSFEYMNPPQAKSGSRTLVQRDDGLWYPKEILQKAQRDARTGVVTYIRKYEVLSFEPLKKRTIKGPATLTVFGKLPPGTVVTELDSEGKKRVHQYGDPAEPGLEEKLLQQAKSIRKKSRESNEK